MSINEDSEPVDIKPNATDFAAHDEDVYASARQWKAQGLRIDEFAEPDTFPRWMREARLWCVSDRFKVPKSLSGPEPVNSDQPELARETWATLTEACAAAKQRGPGWSPGFVVDNKLGALDLDNCRCPRTGALVSWAADCDTVAREIGAHIRPSMSGCGLHIWGAIPRLFIGDKKTIEIGSGKAETWIKPASRHIKAASRVAFAGSDEAQNLEPIIELLEAHAGLSVVEAQQPTREQSAPAREGADERPGDEFNRTGDCAALLAAHGWQLLYERGGASFWRRPGKTHGPRSASLGYLRGADGTPLFWCHSKDAEPIKAKRAYTPFGLLAALEHGNDCSAAARALRPQITATLKVPATKRAPEAAGAIVSTESWPKPIGLPAFIGPIGEYVLRVQGETEADASAILLQALAFFGSRLGRNPRLQWGADAHHGNLFVLVVGDSGDGAKGTGFGIARVLFAKTPDRISDYLASKPLDGVASGQGLLHQMRDPAGDDPGADDKRVLCYQAEFGTFLKLASGRENTLSPVVRSLWESGSACSPSKLSPVTVTDAHFTLIGQVTKTELLQLASSVDIQSGLLGRFLLASSRRPRTIVLPKAIRPSDYEDLREQLRGALRTFAEPTSMALSDCGIEAYSTAHPELVVRRHGHADSLLSRARPHVLRLALVYACSESSKAITARHIHAATAVWRYVVDSTYHAFGRTTGCALADKLCEHLRDNPKGATRKELIDLLARNTTAAKIGQALERLEAQELAARAPCAEGARGRPEERWIARG